MSGSEDAILVRKFAEAHARRTDAEKELRDSEVAYGQVMSQVTGRRAIPQGEARSLTMSDNRILTISRTHGGSYVFTFSDLVIE